MTDNPKPPPPEYPSLEDAGVTPGEWIDDNPEGYSRYRQLEEQYWEDLAAYHAQYGPSNPKTEASGKEIGPDFFDAFVAFHAYNVKKWPEVFKPVLGRFKDAEEYATVTVKWHIDLQAKAYGRPLGENELLQGFGYNRLVFNAFVTGKPKNYLDGKARYPNAPEARIMAQLSANGGMHTGINPDSGLAVYQFKGSIQATLDAKAIYPDKWSLASTSEERHTLIEQTSQMLQGTSRDDVLTAFYILEQLIKSKDGVLDISVTSLLHFKGNTKATAAERRECAERIDRILRQWSLWKAHHKRSWKDADGKNRTINQASSLFHYEGPFFDQLPLGPEYCVPLGFTVVDSSLTKFYRNDPTTLNQIGKLNDLALIPPKKAAADWAVSIGMAVISIGRIKAKTNGDSLRLTRRFLLESYPPNTSVHTILDSKNPGRAVEYWNGAIPILCEQGIISGIEQDATVPRGYGWQKAWLDQVVTVRLAGEYAQTTNQVLENSNARIKKERRAIPKKAR